MAIINRKDRATVSVFLGLSCVLFAISCGLQSPLGKFMDLVYNSTSGRITVFLNGTTHIYCENDYDCPGLAHCKSQGEFDWIEGENSSVTQCVCPWYYASKGALCNEPTGFTFGLFVIVFLTMIFAFGAFVISSRVIYSSVISGKFLQSRAFRFTVVPMFLASIFTVIYPLQWQIRFLNMDNYVMVTETNGLPGKRTSLWVYERTSFVLSFCLFTFALNNFSILWIDVVSAAHQRSNKYRRLYLYFLVIFYCCCFAGTVVFLYRGEFESIAFVCVPGIAIVCVFYCVAWNKVRIAGKSLDSRQASSELSTSASASVKRLLDHVRVVALQVLILTILMLICSALYPIVDNRPYSHIQQFVGMFVFFFASLCEAVVCVFMFKTFVTHSTATASTSKREDDQALIIEPIKVEDVSKGEEDAAKEHAPDNVSVVVLLLLPTPLESEHKTRYSSSMGETLAKQDIA